MGLPALGLGQPGRILTASAIYTPFDGSSMVRSSWVYQQLKRFRAGIEGCIGTLKHTFGLHRCSWKGWPHFQSYVHASVLTYNLVVLARLLL